VGELGLLVEPAEVLGPLQTPEPGPAVSRRVAVEGGDEVDHQLAHVLLRCLVSSGPRATAAGARRRLPSSGPTGPRGRSHRSRCDPAPKSRWSSGPLPALRRQVAAPAMAAVT